MQTESVFRLLSIYYFHCVFIYTVPVCNIMYIVSVLRLLYLAVLCGVFVFRLCPIALIQMLSRVYFCVWNIHVHVLMFRQPRYLTYFCVHTACVCTWT